MFRRKPLKSDKPHALWLYGPKAVIVHSSRPLAQILDSANARARRARGSRILARQIGAPATARALGEFRQIRVEVRAEREEEARRTEARLALGVRINGAAAAMLALVFAALLVVGNLPTTHAGGATENWSGVEVYAPSARPTEITASMVLPPTPTHAVSSNAEDDFWVGEGGDGTFGAAMNAWLPQAGFYILPSGSEWAVSPWAIVCHSEGSFAQYPGYYAPYNLSAPPGTRLTVQLTMRGTDIIATLTERLPKTYGATAVKIVKKLPILPGEVAQYPLVEAILEAPGAEEATSAMALQNNQNTRLVPTAPIHIQTTVTYSELGTMPTVYSDYIYQGPRKWANSTKVTSYHVTDNALTVGSKITDYLAR